MKLHTYRAPLGGAPLWVTVSDEYDGAEDAGRQPVGYGKTPEASVAAFHDDVANIAD